MTPEICTVCGEAIGGRRIYHDRELLLAAVKAAYLKHHLNDLNIGWDELSDELHDALCEVMGDKEFIEWVDNYRDRQKERRGLPLEPTAFVEGIGKRCRVKDYLHEICRRAIKNDHP